MYLVLICAGAVFAQVQSGSAAEISLQLGHDSKILCLAVSPNGDYALSGSEDGEVKLWDIKTGSQIRSLGKYAYYVHTAAFLPDGIRAVAVGRGSAVLYDLRTGKILKDYKLPVSNIEGAALSADGKTLALGGTEKDSSSSNNALALIHVETGEVQKIFTHHGIETKFIVFSANGKKIITAGSNYNLFKVWDTASGKEIKSYTGHENNILCLAVSADGKFLVSGSQDDTMRLWDLESGNPFTMASSKALKVFKSDGRSVYAASFSKDGKTIISGSSSGSVSFWSPNSADIVKKYDIHDDGITALAFLPDNKSFISASEDKTLKMVDAVSGTVIKTFASKGMVLEDAVIDADRQRFLYKDSQGSIHLWSLLEQKFLPVSGTEMPKSSAAKRTITADGKYTIKAEKTNVLVIDNVTGKTIKQITANRPVSRVILSPDNKHVLLQGESKSGYELWDLQSGMMVCTYPTGIYDSYSDSWSFAVFSPDSAYVYIAQGGGSIDKYHTAKKERIGCFEGHNDSITDLAVSADGTYLYSSSADGTLRVWDNKNSKPGEIVTIVEDGMSIKYAYPDTFPELLQFSFFEGGEWAALSPEGFFQGSPKGPSQINVTQGFQVFSMDRFFDTYYRHDLIASRLRPSSNSASLPASLDLRQGIKSPPVIAIEVLTVENGTARVKVTASDTGGGIKGIRLYNNGKAAGENFRGLQVIKSDAAFSQEYVLPLAHGENQLRAVGFSSDMTESEPALKQLIYQRPLGPVKPDMYVLAVGINEYKNSLYNLQYCVSDADGFTALLKTKAGNLFAKVHATLLVNEQATRKGLTGALENIKKSMNPSDVFIFFYAGHGIVIDNEFYYILRDVVQMTSAEKAAADGITGSEFRMMLAEVPAVKQVLFVDACNSGALADKFAFRGAAEENALSKLSKASGSVIFASTTKSQTAGEFEVLKHGIFTYVLLEALGGAGAMANGQLTVKSLMAYVEDKIPEYSKKYRGSEQYATTFLWGQDFPLGMK